MNTGDIRIDTPPSIVDMIANSGDEIYRIVTRRKFRDFARFAKGGPFAKSISDLKFCKGGTLCKIIFVDLQRGDPLQNPGGQIHRIVTRTNLAAERPLRGGIYSDIPGNHPE